MRRGIHGPGIGRVRVRQLRARIDGLLDAWETGALQAAEVRDHAERLAHDLDWPVTSDADGLPANDRTAPGSSERHVLEALETLHLSLITREDIPIMRALLATGDDTTDFDWARWDRHWREIDNELRRRDLATDATYGRLSDH